MSPVLGQIYAPFYYPELSTHRHKNRQIRHENDMFRNFRSIEWHQKNTTKSRDTTNIGSSAHCPPLHTLFYAQVMTIFIRKFNFSEKFFFVQKVDRFHKKI
jgi:hypothetical protein